MLNGLFIKKTSGNRYLAAVAVLSFAAAGGASAATLTGFSGFQDGIVSIDTDTGDVTLVGGDYTGALTNTISGLAYDSTGVLWGLAASSFASVSIGTIDPTTGEYTLIGTDSIGGLSGLAFAPDDTAYSRDGGSPTDFIAEISKTDATPTRIANLGVRAAAGMAISDDGMFAYTVDRDADTLLRYDFTAMTLSVLGTTSADISALTFLDGILYAVTDNAADALLTLDTTTGAELSRVALSTGAFSNIKALAGYSMPDDEVDPDDMPSAVPLPAGGLLLLTGLGALAYRRRKTS